MTVPAPGPCDPINQALPLDDSRFRELLDSAPDTIIITDPEGSILFANRQVEQMLGYAPEELLGQPVELLVPEGAQPTHAQYRASYQAAARTRPMGGGLDLYARHKDGTEIPVDINLSPTHTPQGTLVMSVIRDVSERRQADARFRALLEAAPDAMVIVEPGGKIVLVNSQTEKLFGYSREALLGGPVELLMPERFREQHPAHREAYAGEPHVRPMGAGLELLGRRADGTEFPVEISLSPLTWKDGQLIIAAIRDITERRQADLALARQAEELRRSNQELEQFAYVASHDLQEPLRMVSSYTQLLAKDYGGQLSPEADRYIEFAVDGVKRMQELINDLLAYSRVGTQGREFQTVDAEAVLARVTANLEATILESDAVVTHDPLPKVTADALQLTQLLQNLISNGLKFRGEDPPRVHVSVERREREWVFSIQDNGIGIAPRHLERIFLIFQRLHSRRKYPGTGIGLAICKKIVERHGGNIWVEAEPGKGSTFFFSLPATGAGEP